MANLKPKPATDEFDAWQWRGFVPVDGIDFGNKTSYEVVSNFIEYIMDFEAWAKEHLKRVQVKYRGNDLVLIDSEWGEKVLKPGWWIVMIPEEPGEIPLPNYMTDEQVKSYYSAVVVVVEEYEHD